MCVHQLSVRVGGAGAHRPLRHPVLEVRQPLVPQERAVPQPGRRFSDPLAVVLGRQEGGQGPLGLPPGAITRVPFLFSFAVLVATVVDYHGPVGAALADMSACRYMLLLLMTLPGTVPDDGGSPYGRGADWTGRPPRRAWPVVGTERGFLGRGCGP